MLTAAQSKTRDAFVDLPSLHFIGLADELVVPTRSRALADAFSRAEVVEHDKGHVFPSTGAAMERIIDFCKGHDVAFEIANKAAKVWSSGGGYGTVDEDCVEERAEELEALGEIFEEDKVVVLRDEPGVLRLVLREEEGGGAGEAELYVFMRASYPETEALGIAFCYTRRGEGEEFCRARRIEAALREVAAGSAGDGACVRFGHSETLNN